VAVISQPIRSLRFLNLSPNTQVVGESSAGSVACPGSGAWLGPIHLPPHDEVTTLIYAASWLSGLPLQPAEEEVTFYRRLKPASFELTVPSLSQAWLLGSLRLPHQYLSGAAVSPAACIHRPLRPNNSEPACPGSGATIPSWATCEGHSLIPSSRFVTHPRTRLRWRSRARPATCPASQRSRQPRAARCVPVCVFAFRSRRPVGVDRIGI
jgi:hypothetical protein